MSSVDIDSVTAEHILQFFDDSPVGSLHSEVQQQMMHAVGVQFGHIQYLRVQAYEVYVDTLSHEVVFRNERTRNTYAK